MCGWTDLCKHVHRLCKALAGKMSVGNREDTDSYYAERRKQEHEQVRLRLMHDINANYDAERADLDQLVAGAMAARIRREDASEPVVTTVRVWARCRENVETMTHCRKFLEAHKSSETPLTLYCPSWEQESQRSTAVTGCTMAAEASWRFQRASRPGTRSTYLQFSYKLQVTSYKLQVTRYEKCDDPHTTLFYNDGSDANFIMFKHRCWLLGARGCGQWVEGYAFLSGFVSYYYVPLPAAETQAVEAAAVVSSGSDAAHSETAEKISAAAGPPCTGWCFDKSLCQRQSLVKAEFVAEYAAAGLDVGASSISFNLQMADKQTEPGKCPELTMIEAMDVVGWEPVSCEQEPSGSWAVHHLSWVGGKRRRTRENTPRREAVASQVHKHET